MSVPPSPPRLPQPRAARTALTVAATLASTLAFGALAAQGTPPATPPTQAAQPAKRLALTTDEVRALAEMQMAIGVVHDSADARSAQARNKKDESQAELAKAKQMNVAKIIADRGLTMTEYQRRRYLISTDPALRDQFDSVYAKLTGAPLPGRATAAATVPGFVPASQLPSGLVGTYISHATTSSPDTPDKSGFLVMAFAEAAVAAQHAQLATRTPNDLAAMQLHAGHVLHALDPSLQAMGPGKGFGMKKAALGTANSIDLAAKEATASANVKVHANHIATAARSAAARADQAIALAQQIKAAKDAKDAASLTSQLASVCAQLAAGADSNADGRIEWSGTEGGLQQAQEHIQLMIAGERVR
ncbi:MAG: hypothetical protein LCH84_18525 [Gemmatimonadetes bacterium]|nr:hypothetical protein [Gemmatimonadota bacterium]